MRVSHISDLWNVDVISKYIKSTASHNMLLCNAIHYLSQIPILVDLCILMVSSIKVGGHFMEAK